MLAGLLGGQVTTDAGALGARQGRLDEQQVGVPRGVDELLAGPAVGAEGEPPRLAHEVDGVGEDEMRHLREGRRHRADPDLRVVVVVLDRKGLFDQLLVPPGADHGAEGLASARRHDQPRARRV